MNYRRILLGGLVAGVIINVSEFLLNGVVLADRMEADMQAKGLSFASWAIPAYFVMGFAYGLVLAWLYAAIRPRFGAGMRTAAIAGASLWLAAYALPSVWFLSMGLGEAALYVLGLSWGLVELLLAGAAAGYLYHEVVPAERPVRAPAL